MSKFAPIERAVCTCCGRPESGYYDRRREHMAAAFRSGVQVGIIAAAYGVSQDWAMKEIREQLGHEAVVEVISTYRVKMCKTCGAVHSHPDCPMEVVDV